MLFPSCSKKEESYYVNRGEEVKKELIEELGSCQTLQEILAKQERLSFLFDELSLLIIEARTFQTKSHKTWQPTIQSCQSSERLEEELRRLLAIHGARGAIEKCQVKGLERLDAFEKKMKKNSY
jgi:hypothetical protein